MEKCETVGHIDAAYIWHMQAMGRSVAVHVISKIIIIFSQPKYGLKFQNYSCNAHQFKFDKQNYICASLANCLFNFFNTNIKNDVNLARAFLHIQSPS